MKHNILKVFLSIMIVLVLSLSNSLVGAAASCVYDSEPDGDVDGKDLAAFISSGGSDVASFALEFGKNDCSTDPSTVTVYDFSGITSPSSTHKAEDGEIDVNDAVIAAGAFGARRDSIDGWANWEEATADEYGYLVGSDDVRYQGAHPGRGDNAAMIFEFYIDEEPADIYQIDVAVELSQGRSTDAAYVYLWDYNTNTYLVGGSYTGTDDGIVSFSVAANVENYMESGTGQLTVFVVNMDAGSFNNNDSWIQVDDISVSIHSSTLPMLTMAENPASSGVTDPAVGSKNPYASGTTVDIWATSYAGCTFDSWTGDGVTDPASAITTVVVDGDKTVTANYTVLSSAFLADMDFNASADDNDLRVNDAGQDWYESRQDSAGPTLLNLDETNVGTNDSKKAKITGSSSLNTYLSQEFGSSQTGTFAVEWDIYVDEILDISSNPDRSAYILIGDDSDADEAPNSVDADRFVYMGFFKDGGGTSGTMDLVARDEDDGWTSFSTVAAGLNLDQWYKITVVCNLDADTYDVYVDGVYNSTVTSRTVKDSLTAISFASWNDGAGSFYVDNLQEVSLVTVPDCSGYSESEAISLITGAGFVQGTTSTEYDLTIPAGEVIRTMPAGNTMAPSGATVDLVVSDGPPPELPNVVGDDEATAVATIEGFEGLGLVANVTYEYDDSVDLGIVISQDPAAGTPVFPGDVVDLVVSLGPEPPGLLADTNFEASLDNDDFRDDGPGRDWYESRNDVPTLLFLDETDIGGNSGKKAGFAGSESGNAYMSQELKTAQTGIFSIQWDIFVDEILDISDADRSGFMFIGDSSDGQRGPNSTGSERFVYLAFYKDGGGDDGTMDLMAVEPDGTTMVAEGLNLDQWYTIKVLCDVPNDTYMVYVDGVFQKALTAYTSKTSLSHISFATWNDGAGSFYVDNVMEAESVLYTLTITDSPNGTVTLGPPGGVYPEGTAVALTPVPNAGWLFHLWDGDLAGGDNPAMITMDSDKTITPIFIEASVAVMHVSPTLLDFGSDTSVLTMSVKNNGDESFTWTATTDQPWVIDISPNTSTLESLQSESVVVTIDRSLIGEALPDTNCRMWGAIGTQFSPIPQDVVTSDLDTDDNSLRELTSDYNEEGWGMGYYSEFGDVPVIIRGSIQADYDPDYIPAVNAMAGVDPAGDPPKVALAHVRNCTSGCCVNLGEDIDDPHPFYRQKNGKTWLFMHNGGINKDNLKAAIDDVFEGVEGYYSGKYLEDNPPNGSGIPLCNPLDPDLVVDSELYFLLVLANIEFNNWSVEKGIIETAKLQLIRNSTSNFIMTDGYTIWALRSGHDLAFYHDASGYSVVASEPPVDGEEGWTTMSDNELVILKPGQAPKLINVLAFMEDKYVATIYVDNTLGESVDVQVVAEGPEGVSVPDVTGMTKADAEAEITAAGLVVGDVTVNYTLAVPSGTVIYTDPPAGTYTVLGSAVDFVINLSPVIVDNDDPDNTEFTGTWPDSTEGNPWDPDDPDATAQIGSNGDTFTWFWTPPISAKFDVAVWYTALTGNNQNAQYNIEHADGVTSIYVDQTINGGQWNTLGSFRYEAGVTYAVTLIADGANESYADAVKFTKTGILRHKFTTNLSEGLATQNGQIQPVMGDIDGDGDQEIVMAAGRRIFVVNGKTGVIEWHRTGAIGTAVELADLNNDGTPEILHGMSDSSGPRVRALNGDNTIRWTSTYLKGDWQSMFPLIAFDIDGDGLPSIWFASEDSDPDPYSGNIDDYNGALTMLDHDGNVLNDTWIHHPCWGGMAIADVDNDNVFEIYLGDRREGYHDFPAKGIQAFNAHTLAPLWDRPDIHHSSSIPMLIDVTGDGFLDIVATKITLAGPMILDPLTGETISDYSNRNLPTHAQPTVYDIDEDGNLEFICSTSYPSTASKKFVVFDLVNGTTDFEDSFDFWIAWPPKVGDVTGDGHMEILVATGSQEEEVGDTHNGSYPLIVYDKNYNMIDRVEMPEGTGQLTPARVFDTDGDGYNEVVVAGFNGYLMVYDIDAPTPDPAPRSWVQFYSEYRLGAAEYVPAPGTNP